MSGWTASLLAPVFANHSMLTSSAPSGDIDGGCPSHGAEVMDQAAFLNFSPAEPSCAWNTPHGSRGSQGPPAAVASCSAAGVPTGFGLEDAFCPPLGLHDPSPNKEAQQSLTDYAADVPQEDVRRNVDATAPIQDRVRYIRDQAAAVGFDTLDEVIAAYYTEMFEDTSTLCQDQRLSRNRRLPWLLSTLHNATKNWSEWERRGFQEQITLCAEGILVKEMNSFIVQHPLGAASDEPTNNELAGERLGSRRDPMERRKVQDDVSTRLFACLLLVRLIGRSSLMTN